MKDSLLTALTPSQVAAISKFGQNVVRAADDTGQPAGLSTSYSVSTRAAPSAAAVAASTGQGGDK